jgi:hypothetical protein
MPKKLIDQNQHQQQLEFPPQNDLAFVTESSQSASGQAESESRHRIHAQSTHLNTSRDCVNLRAKLPKSKASNSSTNRFSCNELECLKERFVDFINLEATGPVTSTNSFLMNKPEDNSTGL